MFHGEMRVLIYWVDTWTSAVAMKTRLMTFWRSTLRMPLKLLKPLISLSMGHAWDQVAPGAAAQAEAEELKK